MNKDLKETKEAIIAAVNKFFGEEGKNIQESDDVLEFYDWVSSETDTIVSFDWLGNLAEPTNGESVVTYYSKKLGMTIILENQLACDFNNEYGLTSYLCGLLDTAQRIETWQIIGDMKFHKN